MDPAVHASHLTTQLTSIGVKAAMSIITRLLQSSGDNAGHAKKRLNAYNLWMIMFVSIGSLCYGYTANVISATLGKLRSAFGRGNS
jgi:hypothetical protein